MVIGQCRKNSQKGMSQSEVLALELGVKCPLGLKMEQDSVQSKSLCDLPLELIWEIVMRMGGSDIANLAGTCSYIRDATYANVLWIRRCKKDFDIMVDPLVAEEAGRGSVWAFYSLILRRLGPFLGPLMHTSRHSNAEGGSTMGKHWQVVKRVENGLYLDCRL